MSVGDYCRRELWTVRPDSTVREAACVMHQRDVGLLVAVEKGKAVGALSDRDVALEVLRHKLDPDSLRVRELMRQPVVSIDEKAPLREAIDRMRVEAVRRLVVTDARGELVGLISADDLALLIARELNQLKGPIEAQRVSPPPSLEERRREQAIEWSE